LKRPGIKHNDLTHYFIREHSQLPAAYLASCEKFFKSLKLQAREDIIHEENERLLDRSIKRQAPSCKQQAPSCKLDGWPEPCYSRRIKEK